MTDKAVFFDRDGVLNQDIGYLYKTEDFRWIDGAIETIRYFNEAGFLVVVVTNQSGIARGYYTEEDVQKLHAWMNEQLQEHKAHIDAFYYCPHLPAGQVERYRLACSCRKPEAGLVEQAVKEWKLKREQCFMVGDKDSDIECANKAGIAACKFTGGNLYAFLKQAGWIK